MKKIEYRDYLETFFYILNCYIFAKVFKNFSTTGILEKKWEDLVYFAVILVIVTSVFLFILKIIQLYLMSRNKNTKPLSSAIYILYLVEVLLMSLQLIFIKNRSITPPILIAAFAFILFFISKNASEKLNENN